MTTWPDLLPRLSDRFSVTNTVLPHSSTLPIFASPCHKDQQQATVHQHNTHCTQQPLWYLHKKTDCYREPTKAFYFYMSITAVWHQVLLTVSPRINKHTLTFNFYSQKPNILLVSCEKLTLVECCWTILMSRFVSTNVLLQIANKVKIFLHTDLMSITRPKCS